MQTPSRFANGCPHLRRWRVYNSGHGRAMPLKGARCWCSALQRVGGCGRARQQTSIHLDGQDAASPATRVPFAGMACHRRRAPQVGRTPHPRQGCAGPERGLAGPPMSRRRGHWSGGVGYAHGAGGRRNALTPMEAAVGVFNSALAYRCDPTDIGRRVCRMPWFGGHATATGPEEPCSQSTWWPHTRRQELFATFLIHWCWATAKPAQSTASSKPSSHP